MEIKLLIGSIVALLMMTRPTMAQIPGNPKMDAFLTENQQDFNTQLHRYRTRNYTCFRTFAKYAEGYANITLNTGDSLLQRKKNIVWLMAISKVSDETCGGATLRTVAVHSFQSGLFPGYLSGVMDVCVPSSMPKGLLSLLVGTDGRPAQMCSTVPPDNWEKPVKTYDFY